MPHILPNDEIAESINSFKFKGKGSLQCDSYMGNYMVHNGLNIEPIYIFVSGKGGTGKFIW